MWYSSTIIFNESLLLTDRLFLILDNGGPEEMQDLISEFTLLKDISHSNVIKLLGACTEKGKCPYFYDNINLNSSLLQKL